MKRLLALGPLLLLLAGCTGARPAAVGGVLPSPSPSAAVPTAGLCYDSDLPMSLEMDSFTWYRPGSCTGKHTMELVAARAVTGPVPATAPRPGSDAYKAASALCLPLANAYLGGDYRSTWFQAMVRMPSDAQWQAGDHTYTCELIGADLVPLTYPLKGDLAGARKSVIGCVTLTGSDPDKFGFWDYVTVAGATPCTSQHNGEYVGEVDMPDTLAPPSDNYDPDLNRCEDLAAAYLGVSTKQLLRRLDLDVYGLWPMPDAWSTGEHIMRCYLVLRATKTVAGSVKAHGAATIR